MNDPDYYRQRFVLEAGLTRCVPEQMQQAQSDYRPHPKAPTVGELFWTIMRGLKIRRDLVSRRGADAPPVAPCPSYEKMLASHGDPSKQIEAELATVDQSRWGGKAEFRTGGEIVLTGPGAKSSGCSTSTSSTIAVNHKLSSTNGRKSAFHLRKIGR
jgi:hypothetical protein